MANIVEIADAWLKDLGVRKISEKTKAIAEERIKTCVGCEFVKEFWIWKTIGKVFGQDKENSGLGCKVCTCPINKKALVENETCPKGYWKQ